MAVEVAGGEAARRVGDLVLVRVRLLHEPLHDREDRRVVEALDLVRLQRIRHFICRSARSMPSPILIFWPMVAFSMKATSTSTLVAVMHHAMPPTTLSNGESAAMRARKYPAATKSSQILLEARRVVLLRRFDGVLVFGVEFGLEHIKLLSRVGKRLMQL